MKVILAVATLLSFGFVALAAPDQKTSTLSAARAAVEANLSTPEGKAYDKQLGQDLMQHYADDMRRCKQTAGGKVESFWILLRLEKDGSVKELLLSPQTKIGECDRKILAKAKFSPPPKRDYWAGIYLKMAR